MTLFALLTSCFTGCLDPHGDHDAPPRGGDRSREDLAETLKCVVTGSREAVWKPVQLRTGEKVMPVCRRRGARPINSMLPQLAHAVLSKGVSTIALQPLPRAGCRVTPAAGTMVEDLLNEPQLWSIRMGSGPVDKHRAVTIASRPVPRLSDDSDWEVDLIIEGGDGPAEQKAREAENRPEETETRDRFECRLKVIVSEHAPPVTPFRGRALLHQCNLEASPAIRTPWASATLTPSPQISLPGKRGTTQLEGPGPSTRVHKGDAGDRLDEMIRRIPPPDFPPEPMAEVATQTDPAARAPATAKRAAETNAQANERAMAAVLNNAKVRVAMDRMAKRMASPKSLTGALLACIGAARPSIGELADEVIKQVDEVLAPRNGQRLGGPSEPLPWLRKKAIRRLVEQRFQALPTRDQARWRARTASHGSREFSSTLKRHGQEAKKAPPYPGLPSAYRTDGLAELLGVMKEVAQAPAPQRSDAAGRTKRRSSPLAWLNRLLGPSKKKAQADRLASGQPR